MKKQRLTHSRIFNYRVVSENVFVKAQKPQLDISGDFLLPTSTMQEHLMKVSYKSQPSYVKTGTFN